MLPIFPWIFDLTTEFIHVEKNDTIKYLVLLQETVIPKLKLKPVADGAP